MAPRIYVATDDPESWRNALAEPKKHWRQGYSARALAYCWHAAPVWPPEVATVWLTASHAPLRTPEPLIKLVEHRTPLPGRGFDSQTDLFALARTRDGELVSVVVEGKVNEPFGEPIGEWKAAGREGSDNRQQRLIRLAGWLAWTPCPTTCTTSSCTAPQPLQSKPSASMPVTR